LLQFKREKDGGLQDQLNDRMSGGSARSGMNSPAGKHRASLERGFEGRRRSGAHSASSTNGAYVSSVHAASASATSACGYGPTPNASEQAGLHTLGARLAAERVQRRPNGSIGSSVSRG